MTYVGIDDVTDMEEYMKGRKSYAILFDQTHTHLIVWEKDSKQDTANIDIHRAPSINSSDHVQPRINC